MEDTDGRVPPQTEDLTRLHPMPDDSRYGPPTAGTGEWISVNIRMKINPRLLTVVPAFLAVACMAFFVLGLGDWQAMVAGAGVVLALDQPQLANRTLQRASNVINRIRTEG